jgi:hypothetical protein
MFRSAQRLELTISRLPAAFAFIRLEWRVYAAVPPGFGARVEEDKGEQ